MKRKATNVLISSCSAKVSLTKLFRQALPDGAGKLFVADCVPGIAARFFADQFIAFPKDDAPDFEQQVLKACMIHAVDLIIPTRDGELPLFARMKETLAQAGIQVLVPSSDAVAVCQDKLAFVDFCQENKLPVLPALSLKDVSTFPLFVRPRQGSGSQSVATIKDQKALQNWTYVQGRNWSNNWILQAFCSDPEYSIDLLMDLKGRPLQAVARIREKIVNGESWVTKVVSVPELEQQAMQLGEKLGLVGHNVIQAFYKEETGPRFIEVNPRFGGGSALSVTAGLNSAQRILQMVNGDGEPSGRGEIHYGMRAYKYTVDHIEYGTDVHDNSQLLY